MPRARSDRNGRAHKTRHQGNQSEAKSTKPISDCYECEIDVFDSDLPINKMSDLCKMCGGDHIDGELMQKSFPSSSIADEEGDNFDEQADTNPIRDPENIWVSRFSLKNKNRCFIHYNCALYSPQASFDGVMWSNVRKEMLRGRCFECYNCRKKGPTIKCSAGRCNYIVHFPCALREGYTPSRFQALPSYYCPTHTKANEEEEKRLDRIVQFDLSLGREKIPVIMSNEVDDSPFPKNFEYITINVDSDDILATTQHACEDNFPCCDCVGLCNDINTCACLKAESQRNYSSHGLLISGSSRPILECNVRCGCSISRCTNRIVERGPQYPLQLFRIKNLAGSASKSATATASTVDRSKVNDALVLGLNSNVNSSPLQLKNKRSSAVSSTPGSNKGWGVKTMEEIPEGSFVCELTGQYVDLRKKSTTEKLKKFCSDGDQSSDKDDVTFTDFYQNRLMPIALWDPFCASTIVGSAQSIKSLEPDTSGSIHVSNSHPHPSSSSLSIARLKAPMVSVYDLTGCVTDNVIDECGNMDGDGKNCVNTGENVKVSFDNINQTVDSIDQSTALIADQLKNYPSKENVCELLGTEEEGSENCHPIVCLDCNLFGNIGRFIRQKKRKSSKKIAISGTSLSTVSATPAGGSQPMLLRRLVYTDSSDRRYPKLALFAAHKIPAGTELYI